MEVELKKRCFDFSVEIVKFINQTEITRINHSIFDQLLRSATSIGANVVEGRAASSKKDFINYYQIALKSSNETKYWICLIRSTVLIGNEKLNQLLKEADEISKILASSIIKLKKTI